MVSGARGGVMTGCPRLNKSANTDPQQQEAASPLMLVVRLPLRYAASRRLCVLASDGVAN